MSRWLTCVQQRKNKWYDQIRQVYNLFQEPVKQPLLVFRIPEEKPERINIIKILNERWGRNSTLRFLKIKREIKKFEEKFNGRLKQVVPLAPPKLIPNLWKQILVLRGSKKVSYSIFLLGSIAYHKAYCLQPLCKCSYFTASRPRRHLFIAEPGLLFDNSWSSFSIFCICHWFCWIVHLNYWIAVKLALLDCSFELLDSCKVGSNESRWMTYDHNMKMRWTDEPKRWRKKEHITLVKRYWREREREMCVC